MAYLSNVVQFDRSHVPYVLTIAIGMAWKSLVTTSLDGRRSNSLAMIRPENTMQESFIRLEHDFEVDIHDKQTQARKIITASCQSGYLHRE